MRIAYTVRNLIALRNLRVEFLTVAVLRASCPKISYPPNGHIRQGHLCLIMSGCSPAINSRPLQPLVGWLLREKLTLVI